MGETWTKEPHPYPVADVPLRVSLSLLKAHMLCFGCRAAPTTSEATTEKMRTTLPVSGAGTKDMDASFSLIETAERAAENAIFDERLHRPE